MLKGSFVPRLGMLLSQGCYNKAPVKKNKTKKKKLNKNPTPKNKIIISEVKKSIEWLHDNFDTSRENSSDSKTGQQRQFKLKQGERKV